MLRVLPNPFRKNLIYGFTLKDPVSGSYVGLDAEARAKLAGNQANLNDDTVFYMNEAKSYVALLTKIDAVNGTPYYFSLRGQQVVPFVNFSQICKSCQGNFELALHTNGSPTSPGPGGYLQNVACGIHGYRQGFKTSVFRLRVPNGDHLALDAATGKFSLVKDAAKAQLFEYLNGTIIVHNSYNNSNLYWQNWTVKVLKLNADATAAVLDTVRVQSLTGNTRTMFGENEVTMCRSGVCRILGEPTSAGVLSVLETGELGQLPALVAFFPASSVTNTVAFRFPQDVQKHQRKHMSSAATVGAAVGGVLLGIILIWIIMLFIRSVLVENFLNNSFSSAEQSALSDLMHV
jgi:hypothetical protein